MSSENILNMSVKDWAKKQFNISKYNQRQKTVFQIQRDYQIWRDDLKFINKNGNFENDHFRNGSLQNDHFQNGGEEKEGDATPTNLMSFDSSDMESLPSNSGNDIFASTGVPAFRDFWFQKVIMKCGDHEFRGLFLV